MKAVREDSNAMGTKIEKLQEEYDGIPVFDGIVTVRTDVNGRLTGDASGRIVQDIADDLPDVQRRLTDEETLEIAIRSEGDESMRDRIGDITYKEMIYTDKENKAHLANAVVYLIDSVKRPSYVIDLKSGEILAHWNALDTWSCGKRDYKAYGGNEKMGKIKYGDMPFCLNMTVDGDLCYLENEYVRIVDMQFSENETLEETASFKCKNGYDDEVNGGYSPAVDAFYFGTLVGRMFDDWFDGQPFSDKIVIRVHYGEHFGNAYWNGRNCTFGDGDSDVYPFTVLDIIGHEIGHGVTEFGSDLLYFGEPGGVNEAFSDILGEASEQYLAEADFMTGDDIMKNDPFMRSFSNPSLDKYNMSISKATEMTEDLDPHFSSGVFRRAFYVTVKQKGFPLKDATRVYLHANRNYWHHGSTFFDCSCGVLKAAIDLGFSQTPFKRGFQDVDIEPCDVTSHIFGLANNITQPDVEVSSMVRPLFRFVPTPWTEHVIIEASSTDNSSVHIAVQNGTWEEDDDGNGVNIIAEGDNFLTVTDVDVDHPLFIQLSSDVNVTARVDVTAGYTCSSTYNATGEMMNYMYRYICYGEI